MHSPKGSLRGGDEKGERVDERVDEDDTWTVVLTERQGGGEDERGKERTETQTNNMAHCA